MFVTKDVPALFKKATLKLVAGEDNQTRRVVEMALLFDPFTADLAREMGEDVASHLFDDDQHIRAELSSVVLTPRVGLLRVVARAHLKADGAQLEDIRLVSLSAAVKEDDKRGTRWIALTAILNMSLESSKARAFVFQGFGQPLLWTFEAQQRDLLAEAQMMEAAATLGESGGGVTIKGPDGDVTRLDATTATAHRAAAKRLRQAAHAS